MARSVDLTVDDDDTPDAFDRDERFTAQAQLPGEGGPVELPEVAVMGEFLGLSGDVDSVTRLATRRQRRWRGVASSRLRLNRLAAETVSSGEANGIERHRRTPHADEASRTGPGR